MAGEKMRLTKETAKLVTKELGATDRLSIISYDTEVVCSMPLSQMNATGKKLANEAIASIRPGSSTNLSGGLMRGLEELNDVPQPAETTSVLLLTDGLANCGIRDTQSIVSCLKSVLAARSNPCTVFTFGYGINHDAEMLRSISDSGGGQYYDMEDGDAVASSFADCLGGLLSVVSQNVRLQLTCDGADVARVLSPGYQVSSVEGGSALIIELGDLYSEEFKDILFELALPAGSEAITIKANLSYLDVVRTVLVAAYQVQTIVDRADKASDTPNIEVIEQINRIETVATIKQANDLARAGRYSEGAGLLEEAMKRLQTLSVAKDSMLIATLTADLAECKSGMQNAAIYHTSGSKDCHSMMQSHSKQRSNRVMKKRRAGKPAVNNTPGCTDSPYDTMTKRNIRARWSPASAASIVQTSSAGDSKQRSAPMMPPPQVDSVEASQPSPATTEDFVMVSMSEATPPDYAAPVEASAR